MEGVRVRWEGLEEEGYKMKGLLTNVGEQNFNESRQLQFHKLMTNHNLT